MEFQSLEGPVAVNIASQEALEQAIADRFRTGQGFALATINLDHVVKLRREIEFARAYRVQDFVVADGNPIVWLSRLARKPVTLLTGSDLVLPLARLAAAERVSVALIGSTEDALAQAGAVLQAEVPDLEIATCIAPPMGFDPAGEAAKALLRQVAEAGAGFAFLALGAPKQEILAALGREVVPSMGFAGVGAGLDFLAGAQKRAPKWVRALALEWLWRLLGSPARLFTRYVRCLGVLPALIQDSLRLRRG